MRHDPTITRRRLLGVLGLGSAALALGACAGRPGVGPPVAFARPPAVSSQPAPAAVFDTLDHPYTVDTGDRMRVIVFGQPELSNLYTIDPQGRISLPLIGSVDVRGQTTAEVEGNLRGKLRSGFLRDPQVSIEIDTYRPFYILGEVTTPGQYPFQFGMTAQTAVALATGYTPRARSDMVEITRNISGRLVRSQVPIHHPLRPGDTVRVLERWF